MLIGIVSIEAIFQIEEWIFRQDRPRLRQSLEASFRENGALSSEEVVRAEAPDMRSGHLMLRPAGEDFTIFWNRPLCRGHSIVYSAADSKIRIQD